MNRPRPRYTDKNSTQTLSQGLEEYYTVNSDFTHPSKMPPDFAKIMLAHDASHVIYGCDTDMYDEMKILPLTFWTSDFKFRDYIRVNREPVTKAMIDAMFNDLLKRYGVWFYGSIFTAILRVLPEVISMWFKTRKRQRYITYLNFEPFLNHSLLEIRQEFDLLPFIK